MFGASIGTGVAADLCCFYPLPIHFLLLFTPYVKMIDGTRS